MTQLHPSQSLSVIQFEHSLNARRAAEEHLASEAGGRQGWIERGTERLRTIIRFNSEFFKSRYGSGQGNTSEPAHS